MPKVIKPLSATEIKSAKPKTKKYQLSDGGGLSLIILPSGSKRWVLNYRYNNKQKEYAIGTYPEIKLADARAKREELRELVAKGIDIALLKQEEKKARLLEEDKNHNTFEKVAKEWHKNYIDQVSQNYHEKLERALENYIYPFIKNKPIDEVTRLDLIEILQDLKKRGLLETAKRTFNILNKVFMYGVTLEYCPHNITADIDKKVILGKVEKKHYPTLTKKEDIKGLLLAIDDYKGDYSTKMALKLLPYVFVRSYNIRYMDWSEIDFENQEWIISSEKMKVKDRGDFILPLPQQAIEILSKVIQNQYSNMYVFPSFRGKDNPMSDNTLISALRRMGYTKDELVPHSFRSIFSTIAYENQHIHRFSSEIIESLMAHVEKNKVKSAYNRAEYKEQKRKLIQWYADYLDGVRDEK